MIDVFRMHSSTTLATLADHHDHVPPVSDKEYPQHTHMNGNDMHHFHYHDDYVQHPQSPYGFVHSHGGYYPPALFKPYEHRTFANPAPLGLSAFALTTFVLSCINMHVRGESAPNIVVPLAFGYGGLVQLLAGMWEMAVGNTFGATALSSYGGFWIAYGLLLTPSFNILGAEGPYEGDTGSVMGFFLTGWFIFNTLLLVCTLRSTVVFFLLFFVLDCCLLCLACENFAHDLGREAAKAALQKAGGFFGFLAAFLAWYNALAGMQDSSNSFFQVPVFHLPWSDKGMELRQQKKHERDMA